MCIGIIGTPFIGYGRNWIIFCSQTYHLFALQRIVECIKFHYRQIASFLKHPLHVQILRSDVRSLIVPYIQLSLFFLDGSILLGYRISDAEEQSVALLAEGDGSVLRYQHTLRQSFNIVGNQLHRLRILHIHATSIDFHILVELLGRVCISIKSNAGTIVRHNGALDIGLLMCFENHLAHPCFRVVYKELLGSIRSYAEQLFALLIKSHHIDVLQRIHYNSLLEIVNQRQHLFLAFGFRFLLIGYRILGSFRLVHFNVECHEISRFAWCFHPLQGREFHKFLGLQVQDAQGIFRSLVAFQFLALGFLSLFIERTDGEIHVFPVV